MSEPAELTPEQSADHLGSIRTLATSTLLSRISALRQAGISFDGLRDMYAVLGYKRELTTQDYRERYARGGVTKRIVEALPKATWRGDVEIVEDEDPDKITTFEQAWIDLEKRLKVKTTLLRADILAGLSTYAIILIGAPGELNTELPKGLPEKLIYFTPFSGGGGPVAGNRSQTVSLDADATIEQFDEDPASPRFGLPLTYKIRRVDFKTPTFQQPVHWSRVIHVAEGCLDDEVYGQPTLESVWNLLDDLDKVTGGGAEAFWLRANQGLQLDVDKDTDLSAAAKTDLQRQADEYAHQMRRMLRTRGVTATPLGSDVANFSNPADAILTQIAGAKGIPKRILTGSEMGELASSQDRDNWRDQVNGRQTGYAEPNILRRLVDRLIDYGYLPQPVKGADGYAVRWAPMQVLTEQEKAAGAQQWASTNQTAGTAVFTEEEIRDHWYGMAPLTPEQKQQAVEDKQAGAPPQPELAPAESRLPRAAQGHKLSSAQVQLPKALAAKLLAFGKTIPDDDLAADGREEDVHVTVKYGLHTQDVADVRKAVAGFVGPVELALGKMAVFKGEGHDVLYVSVDSGDLRKLNAKIAGALEVTDTHEGYRPHATIAYLKLGLGKKYAGDARFEGLQAEVTVLTFSPAEGADEVIDLSLRAAGESETLVLLDQAIASGNHEVADRILAEHQGLPEALASVEAAIRANDAATLERMTGVRAPAMMEAVAQEPQTIVVNSTPPSPLRLASSRKKIEYDSQGRIVAIVREPIEATS